MKRSRISFQETNSETRIASAGGIQDAASAEYVSKSPQTRITVSSRLNLDKEFWEKIMKDSRFLALLLDGLLPKTGEWILREFTGRAAKQVLTKLRGEELDLDKITPGIRLLANYINLDPSEDMAYQLLAACIDITNEVTGTHLIDKDWLIHVHVHIKDREPDKYDKSVAEFVNKLIEKAKAENQSRSSIEVAPPNEGNHYINTRKERAKRCVYDEVNDDWILESSGKGQADMVHFTKHFNAGEEMTLYFIIQTYLQQTGVKIISEGTEYKTEVLPPNSVEWQVIKADIKYLIQERREDEISACIQSFLMENQCMKISLCRGYEWYAKNTDTYNGISPWLTIFQMWVVDLKEKSLNEACLLTTRQKKVKEGIAAMMGLAQKTANLEFLPEIAKKNQKHTHGLLV
jgi:hypothetical protein